METVEIGQIWIARDGTHQVGILQGMLNPLEGWAVRCDDGRVLSVRRHRLQADYILRRQTHTVAPGATKPQLTVPSVIGTRGSVGEKATATRN
jgi:hypothetical protein